MQPELYRHMRDIEDRHWWFRGRRRIVSGFLRRMELPSTARILDLGCGTGGNLEMLSGHGLVTGVEMNPEALALARQRAIAEVLPGSLPDSLDLETGSFDCITMLDVLEHVEQDAAGLETVFSLLCRGGRLLLTVPAFPFLWGPHDEAHHHHRRYRAKNLRTKLEEAGFEVRHLSYFNSWLFPPVALVRLVQRWLPAGKADSKESVPPAIINSLLETLFASEGFILARGRFPFGVSLLAMAQKR